MHPRREEIARTAAALMNRGGYVQTPVSELLAATGLEKGGLYHHFASKEEIAIAAFDHANGALRERMAAAIDSAARPREQLLAMVDAAFDQVCSPSEMGGGCPMINLSASAGDRHPVLREHAAAAMGELREGARALLRADPDPPPDPDALGDLVVTLVEGAIAVRDVTGDDAVIAPARAHIHDLLEVSP